MNNPEYKGRPWSYGIIAVIVFFMVATLGFVFFAFTQKVDLVTKDYYEKSIGYDSVMASQSRGLNDNGISVTFSNSSVLIKRNSPEILRAEAILYRPIDSSLDTRFKIEFDSTDIFSIPVENIQQTNVIVQLNWLSGGQVFERKWPSMPKK